MKRKIIQQGSGGLTIYLPKKWTDEKRLLRGDEVEVKESEQGLLIIPEKKRQEKRTISLKIKKSRESALRTALVNANRAGFDIIELDYSGEKKEVQTIVHTLLLGFDVFKKEGNTYVLENMSEPAGDNFENIVIKQFYLVGEILANFTQRDVTDETHKIQRYDHFLKRCLSKDAYADAGRFFIWQFLSHLTQTARLCFHFQKEFGDCQNRIEKNQVLHEAVQTIRGMFSFLQKAYLKQEISFLKELHEADERMLKKKKQILCAEEVELGHQLLLIERNIYLANSPLMGLLHIRSFQAKS